MDLRDPSTESLYLQVSSAIFACDDFRCPLDGMESAGVSLPDCELCFLPYPCEVGHGRMLAQSAGKINIIVHGPVVRALMNMWAYVLTGHSVGSAAACISPTSAICRGPVHVWSHCPTWCCGVGGESNSAATMVHFMIVAPHSSKILSLQT